MFRRLDDLDPEQIDPIHPLAKDADLRRRYRQARATD